MMETKKTVISLRNIEDDDPELAALFQVADAVYDEFEKLLKQTIVVDNNRLTFPGSPRDCENVRRWTLYLGTMAAEMLLGTMQLSVSDMPRAQLMLNRQLFEYFIRNQWMVQNSGDATRLMDSLQGLVNKEVQGTQRLFDPATRSKLAKNYEEWKTECKDLDKLVSSETRFKQMCRDVLGDKFDTDFFWCYGFPSILAHGKPHGVPDVLAALGGGLLTRSLHSVWLDRKILLSNATGIVLQYASFIALNFDLDLTTARGLNERFARALVEFGVEAEAVAVRRIT